MVKSLGVLKSVTVSIGESIITNFPKTGPHLNKKLKTKELDGYILVSDTNYSSTLDNNWLIEMGLREPLHKINKRAHSVQP